MNPDDQKQPERTRLDRFEAHRGRRLGEHIRMVRRHARDGVACFIHGFSDVRRNVDAQARSLERVRMVDDLARDQQVIGHDQHGAVAGEQRRRPKPDLLDGARRGPERHEVVLADGLLDQDHDARDDVPYDRLQAEPDAHQQGAGRQDEG